MKKHELAQDTFQRAIELRPDDWVPHKRLGNYYYLHGEFDEAIAQYEKVIELTPNNFFNGYTDIGAIHLIENRLDEAKAMLKKSLSIKESYPAFSNLGVA